MKVAIGPVLIFCLSLSYSTNLPRWSKGSLVLNSGDVKAGEISFQGPELILFRLNGSVSVYGPHQAKSFYYYDAMSNTNRKFFSSKSLTGRHPMFYEIVVWGEVQVVRHLKHRMVPERNLSDKHDYDYFVLLEGSLIDLGRFTRKVFPTLAAKSSLFEEQVRNGRLNPAHASDAIVIVKLYNQIVTRTAPSIASGN